MFRGRGSCIVCNRVNWSFVEIFYEEDYRNKIVTPFSPFLSESETGGHLQTRP